MAYSVRTPQSGFIVAIIIAAFTLFSFLSKKEFNPITGQNQYVGLNVEQEVALGLKSAPQMAQRHGGLHADRQAQAMVKKVGQDIVSKSAAGKSAYQYDFHLLADNQTINAFALPGGQIFITAALYSRLQSVDQLAGVLGHEIAHVVARHSAERIAQQQLSEGLTGAAVMASGNSAQMAQMIGNLVTMKYGREDELESDDLGVRFVMEAGYDPQAMVGVMKILDEAASGNRQPEFYSTHPSPRNRVAKIQEAILKYSK